MGILKKDINQMTNDLKKTLVGKKQGDVIVIPIGEHLFPNFFLMPEIEIVLLDPDENFIAYRSKSHSDASKRQLGAWMLGKPAAVAGFALEWLEKMTELKQDSLNK